MVENGRPLKRMKRRVTADLYDFLRFPLSSSSSASMSGDNNDGDGDVDIAFTGPFRSNVRNFLSKHALLPPPSSLFPHLMTWQILFRIGDLMIEGGPDSQPALVYLDIVEEDVSRSRSIYCDQCRVVGWSGHPVCGKRYHFIIKANGSSIGGYHKPCMCCGDVLHLSESKCKSCNHITSTDDVEDWVYQQLENNTHLLHAVVHSNGFGHLLRVNGREGGSKHLSGSHIMDFWDRFCKLLGVRKVSVMDVSKKYGVEYRLLHAIVNGHPWYGEWGYEFGAGSFAVTLNAYKMAVETLSSLPLSIFISQGRKPRSQLQDIISYYQSLSEQKLVTVRDLFRFLMSLIRNVRKSSSTINDVTDEKQQKPKVLCSWTRSDVTRVEEAMLKVLHAVSGSNWVTWRTLRGAVCKAGSPELLDYCLKNLGGKISTDGMIVNAQRNPQSGAFEYRLEPGSASSDTATACSESYISNYPSEDNLLLDLRYLYEAMLQPQTMISYGPQATRDVAMSSAEKLLDCKQFVKDYKPERLSSKQNPSAICLSCEVEVVEDSKDNSTRPPSELVVLPCNATMSDLKLEVSKAFQDVYLMFRRFQAEEIVDHGGVDDSTQVKLLFGQTESVRVRGRCHGKTALNRFRMERGVERWTVDCSCGAKDDDGERMLACDACGVWQHTRCSGIHDSDSVPGKFVCYKCRSSIAVMDTSEETEIKYPAPGAPELAKRVKEVLMDAGFKRVDEEKGRGLDHGAWVPLMLMYPEADIPVCQLSVQTNKNGAYHYNLGRALAPLKNEGVLIIGSGSATHNLRTLDRSGKSTSVAPWALEFDNWLKDALLQGRHEDVNEYEKKAPHAKMSHPSPDHIYPLHVAIGAAGDNSKAKLVHHSWDHGTMSYASYQFTTPTNT